MVPDNFIFQSGKSKAAAFFPYRKTDNQGKNSRTDKYRDWIFSFDDAIIPESILYQHILSYRECSDG